MNPAEAAENDLSRLSTPGHETRVWRSLYLLHSVKSCTPGILLCSLTLELQFGACASSCSPPLVNPSFFVDVAAGAVS